MQKGCRYQLSVAKWTDCWDLNIDLESNKINLSISTRTKASAVYFGLSKKVKRHRKSKHGRNAAVKFLYNPWTIKSDIFCVCVFFFPKRALVFHNISVCKSPKNDQSKWCTSTRMIISKMYSPLAEEHATLGWSADGWVPLQPSNHFYILHLSALCTQWGEQQRIFVLPPFFLHAVLLWSRQTRSKNPKPSLMDTENRERQVS